jgi:phosphoesterase RecJ-like protein
MTDILIDPALVRAAGELVARAERVVVVTHMSPDGDAMGSSLAMRRYLEQKGKQVDVIVPNRFPAFLSWMPGADRDLVYDTAQNEADRLLDEADLIVCTDFNAPKRIGLLGEKILSLPCKKMVIDHHLFPEPFADAVISFPQTASASELVFRLLCRLEQGTGWKPDRDLATCIYTGMMTDTGNFSFNSNNAEMYMIVAELVAAGVDKDAVYNEIFNAWTADRMRLMGYCLCHKMQIFPEHHAALIALSRPELYRFNFQHGDAEGLVNLPLQIKDIYYSCFMRADKVYPAELHLAGGSKTKIKISMRSQGDRPVNTFCADVFSGGGHKNASGGEFYGPLTHAVELFMQNYPRYFS